MTTKLTPPDEEPVNNYKQNMNNTKNTTNVEVNILHKYPFAPQFIAMPNYLIRGSSLYRSSGDDYVDLGLSPWLDAKLKEIDLNFRGHLYIIDILRDDEEIHVSAAAGLKIAATFDNELGADARTYLDNLAYTNRHDYSGALTPLRVMLAELQRHQRKLHRVMEEDAKWHDMGQVHKQCSATPDKLRTPNEAINAAYSKDVGDLARDKMLHAGTRRFNKVREIVAKMEALYASPLYAAAVAQGLAPKLED